jgi:hypothetical protein
MTIRMMKELMVAQRLEWSEGKAGAIGVLKA